MNHAAHHLIHISRWPRPMVFPIYQSYLYHTTAKLENNRTGNRSKNPSFLLYVTQGTARWFLRDPTLLSFGKFLQFRYLSVVLSRHSIESLPSLVTSLQPLSNFTISTSHSRIGLPNHSMNIRIRGLICDIRCSNIEPYRISNLFESWDIRSIESPRISKRPGVGFAWGRECPNLASAGNWPFWDLAWAVNFINLWPS